MLSIANAQPAHRPRRARIAGIRRLIGAVIRVPIRVLEVALEVRRERRMLLTLDDRILSDIGLSRYDAWAEADRSPWDIPRDRLWSGFHPPL
jgi:uncharacterized protein YjiS (DUF1127 family)